jgi:PAS domain-containing protein
MPSAHRPDRQFSYIIKPWPLGVAIFATDVTERVELTRRKLRNEAIEMTLQHVSGVGVGVINRGGVIEFANAGFGNMMGSRDGDLAGQSFLSFLSPDCRSTVRDYLEHGQEEPVAIPVSYLRNGTDMASAML